MRWGHWENPTPSSEIEPDFVHSSQQRIDQGKQDWLDGAYDPVSDDDEFIPLPGT